MKRARVRAFEIVEADPELASHPTLKRELEERFAESIDWLFHA